MLDHLRQIAIFAKTVELGSFRNAAEALHLSPSVVSHHISKLEEELGVALLYRSTRKLSLTSDGKKLLVSAQSMIDSAETFFSVATNQSTQKQDTRTGYTFCEYTVCCIKKFLTNRNNTESNIQNRKKETGHDLLPEPLN